MMEHMAISRKRKQERIDGNLGANKKHSCDNGGIENLPDDVLINILSHMSLNGAARTSVLARRWRSLWRFSFGTLLQFDQRGNTSTGYETRCEEFMSWVNSVTKVHQGRHIEGIVVNFDAGWSYLLCNMMSYAVKDLVCIASRKEVQMLEVKLSLHNEYHDDYFAYRTYKFPRVESLISLSDGVASPFRRLRTLRLANFGIMDDVVHYFLASCPDLEELCIRFSSLLQNLRVVDPPSLRVLEMSRCLGIHSLEISAVNLVSLTYGGRKSSLMMKNIPNVRELTLVDDSCVSFVSEPWEHSSYSIQLEKLVLDIQKLGYRYRQIVAPPDLPQLSALKRLEVKVFTLLGRRLQFTSLIKGSPHLHEFRIELSYSRFAQTFRRPPFPGIISKVGKFVHRNLKVVEMAGYIGCRFSEELLLELTKRCPSIERVFIDTQSDYYDDDRRGKKLKYGSDITTQSEAKERAKRFVSNIPKPIQVIVS